MGNSIFQKLNFHKMIAEFVAEEQDSWVSQFLTHIVVCV
jgi:hypothetical protein